MDRAQPVDVRQRGARDLCDSQSDRRERIGREHAQRWRKGTCRARRSEPLLQQLRTLSELGQIRDSLSQFSFAAEGVWEMKYRKLGNTGLIVSEVALGTMQFGGKMNMGNLGQEDTTRMVKLALDKGINFIDTADVYSLGESETLVGNALKGVRTEIVLATKVRLPMSDNLNRSGATRVNIMREVEG